MKFTEVKELPRARRKTNIRVRLDEFMSMGIKFAKLEYDAGEYKLPKYACGAFNISAKTGGYPIDVKMINGEVYLIRKDM